MVLPVQRGIVADTPDKAVACSQKVSRLDTGSKWFVMLKHKFMPVAAEKEQSKKPGSRGVVLAKSMDEVFEKFESYIRRHPGYEIQYRSCRKESE